MVHDIALEDILARHDLVCRLIDYLLSMEFKHVKELKLT